MLLVILTLLREDKTKPSPEDAYRLYLWELELFQQLIDNNNYYYFFFQKAGEATLQLPKRWKLSK